MQSFSHSLKRLHVILRESGAIGGKTGPAVAQEGRCGHVQRNVANYTVNREGTVGHPTKKSHSYRRAIIGSTLVARRAGM
jgi:hypothetical protein